MRPPRRVRCPRSQVLAAQRDFAQRLLLDGESEAEVVDALRATFRMHRPTALAVIEAARAAATAP